MGRHAQGYQVRAPRRKGGCWTVRFRHQGARVELSTGQRDRGAAEREARRIYAEHVTGRPTQGRAVATLTPGVTSAWLDELPVREVTRRLYEKYTVYWLREMPVLSESGIASYTRRRLRAVRGKTVRSELSALRRLIAWLVEQGYLDEPIAVPDLSSADLGTPYGTRRRVAAPQLTEAEVRAVLRRLPERSATGWWVRPRCELLYETGLRPSTVDALSVPEHWAPGSRTLLVTQDIDKEGFERELPLSPRAQRILRRCAPGAGVIFGPHRYDPYVREAAKALGTSKAKLLTSQHLRSARATHLLDAGAELTGVQWLLGHKHTSTTARYVRPSFNAAKSALKRRK